MARGESTACWQGIDISGAGFLATLLNLLALIFYGVSLGTDRWAQAPADANNRFEVRMGLFEWCDRRCQPYVDNAFPPTGQNDLNLVTRMDAVAAFSIIGLILTFFAMVVTIFSIGRTGFHGAVNMAAKVALLAAFSGLLGIVIFARLLDILPSRFDMGYSYGLAIGAWLVTCLTAGLLTIDSRNITYRSPEDAARRGGAGMI